MSGIDLTDQQIMAALHYSGSLIVPGYFTVSIPDAQSTWPGYGAGTEPTSPNVFTPLNSTQAANFLLAINEWDKIIALNLTAAFDASRLAIPHMKAQKWGRIINMASAHSLVASPFKSAYVSAKHGLAGFTKTLALELATFGVTANCISPGYVWTPLVENQIPDTMKARNLTREQVINDVFLAGQPTKQFVQPSDIGELAVFLCRDAAAQMNGSNISIDGGWTAG